MHSASSLRQVGSSRRSRLLLATGIASAVAWLAGTTTTRAELTWVEKAIELHADGKSSALEARFRFTNAGAQPVDIGQIETSCGCTTAVPTKRHYEPGQTGEIVARYTVGEQTGLQKKLIAVTTSDHPGATMLTLIVHVPELVHLQPRILTWEPGEAREAKTLEVTSGDAATPLAELAVQSSNPAMTVTVLPLLEGSGYVVSVRPGTTPQRLFTTLTIRCRVGTEEKVLHAYASEQSAPR